LARRICSASSRSWLSGLFPDGFRDAQGHVGVYFEAGAVIIVLVLLGQVMELGARERTGSAIRALLDLAAKTARVIRADGREEEIPLEEVVVGDHVRVRPGDKVPVDGIGNRRPFVDRRVDDLGRSRCRWKRSLATPSPGRRSTAPGR
jgi:cation transport ATPase